MAKKKYRYNAFISYSHAADASLSPLIQKTLQQFAKPWYKLRMLSIYLDQTNLSATPELWPSIQSAISISEYFLLFASPAAAQSKWVKKEVSWWLENRPVNRLLFILTDGEINWSDNDNDFDWLNTNALPDILRGKFLYEPNYMDFRWAKKSDELTLRNPLFLENILSIASPLHGKNKEDLGGEDVRQHRITRILAWTVGLIITVASCIAIWQAIIANKQRKIAQKQSEVSLARQLSAQSDLLQSSDFKALPLAVLLSAEAIKLYSTSEISQVIWKELELLPELLAEVQHKDVSQIKFSADGRLVGTAGSDSTARVTNLADKGIVVATRHDGPVWDISFSPNGSLVASCGIDGVIKVMDIDSKKVLYEFRHKGPVRRIVFNKAGNLLASAGEDNEAIIWNLNNGKAVTHIRHNDKVWSLAFSHNDKYLATASRDSTIILYDLSKQSIKYHLRHDGILWNVYFSPDDKFLLSVSDDHTARLWSVSSGKELKRFEHTARVMAAAFSPDGKKIVTTAWDGTIKFWSTDGFRQLATINTGKEIYSVAYSGDSKFIITGGLTTSVWNAETYKEVNRMYKELSSYSVSFSPDNLYLATADSKTGRVWKVTDKNHQALETKDRIEGKGVPIITNGWQIASANTGNLLLTGGPEGYVSLWNLEEAKKVIAFQHGKPTNAVAFLEEKSIGAAASDSIVDIFNTKTGKLYGKYHHKKEIISIDIDGEGEYFAIGAEDSLIIVSVKSMSPVFKAVTPDPLYFVSFNYNSALVTTISSGGELGIWNWKKAVLVKTQKFDNLNSVKMINNKEAVSFITDSLFENIFLDDKKLREVRLPIKHGWCFSQTEKANLLAISALHSQRVSVYDLKTADSLNEFDNGAEVYSVCFDPSGRYLAIGCSDGTIHIWDYPEKTKVAVIRWDADYSVDNLEFSFDGRYIVAANSHYETAAWLWKPEDAIAKTCLLLHKGLTYNEWKFYMGNRPFKPIFCK